MQKLDTFIEQYKKKNLPPVQPGDTVRVYEKFFDRNKERVQVFEGIVIAKKHGNEIGATITVRRVLDGVGVEKTFPLHSPTIEKIEIVKRAKVRRSKLYYLRNIIGKIRLRKKNIDVELLQPKEEPTEEPQEEPKEEVKGNEQPEEVEQEIKEEKTLPEDEQEKKEDEKKEEGQVLEGKEENIEEENKNQENENSQKEEPQSSEENTNETEKG